MKEAAPRDFALAPGGPVDRIQAWLRITSPDSMRLGRRALAIAMIAWLPLAAMTLLRPASGADVPFLCDIAAHVRFLLIIPLLIIAEGTIRNRSRMVVQTLRTSGLVPEADLPRYEATVKRGRRLIDSTVAEVVVIALSAGLVSALIHGSMAEPAVFWFEQPDSNGTLLSNAGWWYAAVATPVFFFLLLRWTWRYLVWWWFLGRVSRLDLRLTGTHPDRVGGLGFIMFHHAVFASVTFALGCAVSAAAANRILYADATLRNFQWPILGMAVFAVLMGIAPMLVFTIPLVKAKRKAWMEYSAFASNYVVAFEEKWLHGKSDEEALGSGDIQSLTDLGGSFERMVQMRDVAVDRRLIFVFLIAAVAPALPLILTVMPLKEIVRVLVKAMM